MKRRIPTREKWSRDVSIGEIYLQNASCPLDKLLGWLVEVKFGVKRPFAEFAPRGGSLSTLDQNFSTHGSQSFRGVEDIYSSNFASISPFPIPRNLTTSSHTSSPSFRNFSKSFPLMQASSQIK